MTTVVGVSFVRAGKVYWFDPNGLELQDGQPVIVETVRGTDYGVVSGKIVEVLDELVVQPLRRVVRPADAQDEETLENNKRKEIDAFSIAQSKILRHKLEMKLVDVEYAFDGSRIVFYFTANGRVDFRELVRDLASVFRARIELRQIGVRDEAKMIGGLGPCGRPICCRQFLADFQPVSIKMAKEQNLSLNPAKISGLCGRLMCCLKYEQDHYEAAHKSMPRVGREVETPAGTGIVTDVNVLKEQLTVKLFTKDGLEFRKFPFDALEPHAPGEKYVLRHVEPIKEVDEDELFSLQFRDEPILREQATPGEGEEQPVPDKRPPRRQQPRRPRPPRQEGEKAASEAQTKPSGQEPQDGHPKGDRAPKRRGGRRRGGRPPQGGQNGAGSPGAPGV